MPDYHLYALKGDGQVAAPPTEFFATSDETAISFAAAQDGGHGCELWERDRFVAFVQKRGAMGG